MRGTFTAALVGADGAGKSTIGKALAAELPLPLVYVYMGVNLEASNLTLPTTRLYLELKRRRGGRPDLAGPQDPDQRPQRPSGARARAKAAGKTTLRLTSYLAEEWFRQVVVWGHRARGSNVLFDRHFYLDYYFHDVAPPRRVPALSRRVHGFVLRRCYPKPDLVICLDAPAEVMHARKPEGSLQGLERRRREYLALADVVPRFAVVDATRPREEVQGAVGELLMAFARERALP